MILGYNTKVEIHYKANHDVSALTPFTHKLQELGENIKPWGVLSTAFASFIAINGTFFLLFPAEGYRPLDMLNAINPFNPNGATLNAAYVYQNRAPETVLGDFNYMMGSQLAARGQIIAAESFLAKASALKPKDSHTQLTYGSVLEALGKLDKSANIYQKSINANPANVAGFYRLGMLYDRMGETRKGIDVLHQALLLEPEDAYLNYDIGVLYSKSGDYNGSATYSKRAFLADDQFAEAYNNYGYALGNLGRYEQALVAVDKALKLKPDNAASLDTRGFALQGLKRYREAIIDYDKAIKLDPSIGEIYLHKAQTLEKMNRLKDALDNYLKYIIMAPKAPDREEVNIKIAALKKTLGIKDVKKETKNNEEKPKTEVAPETVDDIDGIEDLESTPKHAE